MPRKPVAPFCNYEHLGGCSAQLTYRMDYWVGATRKRFGPYAHWCEAHAPEALHLPLERLDAPIKRHRSAKRKAQR